MPHQLDKWMYSGGRPNRTARFLNGIWRLVGVIGLPPRRLNTLEVRGRRTGRLRSFPVVVADYEGERYLVAMLGERANWVANVRAAGGQAMLRHGGREQVRLEEVDPDSRAPILQRYLQLAPGARSHVPVDRLAPLADFEAITGQYPVFHVCPGSWKPSRTRPDPRGMAAGSRAAGVLHRVTNPLVAAVLRSRLHPLLSNSLLLLTVRGRRTGRYHTLPVQYARVDQTVYIVPGGHEHKTWWRNLLTPARVQVRLKGDDLTGTGQVILAEHDPEVVAQAMRTYLPRFPSSARLRGLTVIDGQIAEDDAQLQAATAHDGIVQIKLQP